MQKAKQVVYTSFKTVTLSTAVNLQQVNSTYCLLMIICEVCHGIFKQDLQRIQVECLTASVVVFVVTVELIALRGKMTDVAGQE